MGINCRKWSSEGFTLKSFDLLAYVMYVCLPLISAG